MKHIIKLTILIPIILTTSCNPADIDLTPPTIEEISYSPAPITDDICGSEDPNVFLLKGGESLECMLLFKDNEALTQYKIDIHNNFDCHGHGGGSAPNVIAPGVDNQTTDWTVLDIQNISGVSEQAEIVLNVPENVTAGNYHFHIQVIDEAGNDSPFTNFYSLKITNPQDNIAPTITVEEPATSNFTVIKGSTINFKGSVTDDRSLSDGGNGVLYLAYTDLSSGNTFATDIAVPFGNEVGTSYDFDLEYTVPLTLVEGEYRFSLGANDGVRNVAPFIFFDANVTN